jgi:hypothetical protein
MYALGDASGATAMTRIIWGARKKTPRGQQGAAKGHVSHFEFAIS